MLPLSLRTLPFALGDVEIVEHKGLGHPDTICDGVAEAASRALSRTYLERHATILHHNVDKALLVGGRTDARLGGGTVLDPMVLHLAGRASGDDASEIAVEAARAWLRQTMHALDVDRDVRIVPWIRAGSSDLVDLFERGRRANDTSFGAGFAPLSITERAVLASAHRLRELARSASSPEVGEDIKILAVRRGDRLALTVACAIIGAHVPSLARYLERRANVASEVYRAATSAVDGAFDVDVVVNGADDVARPSVYVTVTGTSAEAGDDGQVGRGNRVNGLITPGRPMTLEAAAGKNPVTHVGKLYAVTANAIAADVASDVDGVSRAECVLASRIGSPIDEPEIVDIGVALEDGASLGDVRDRVEAIAVRRVAAVPSLWRPIVIGEIALY